jgi:uncharacterized membrane protein YiaA
VIALGALKVAAVAAAVAVAAWVVFAVGLMTLDTEDRLMGTFNGNYVINRHPYLLAAVLMCIAGGVTAAVALLVAAIAWAVGV